MRRAPVVLLVVATVAPIVAVFTLRKASGPSPASLVASLRPGMAEAVVVRTLHPGSGAFSVAAESENGGLEKSEHAVSADRFVRLYWRTAKKGGRVLDRYEVRDGAPENESIELYRQIGPFVLHL